MSPEVAAAFVRRLASVPEPAMREALWRERLAAPDTATVLAIVEAVATQPGRTGAWEVAWLALVRCLERAPAETTDRLRALAQVTGRAAILELFVDAAPARVAHEDEIRPVPLLTDREVTLGERRWWARRPDRDLIDRLLFDQDPGVIENLLRNPRVVVQDVVRVASRRPSGAAILRLVFQHPVWGRRREVQLALAQNPYAPVDVARALVAVLDREVLGRLVEEPSLHPTVREMARAQLDLRGDPVGARGLHTEAVWAIEEEAEEEA